MARRRRRAIIVEFDSLLAASKPLAVFHGSARAQGYAVRSARLWRRRDGTCTARVVWRHPAAAIGTLTFSVEGVVLR